MNRLFLSLILICTHALTWAYSTNSHGLPWAESGYNVTFPEGMSSRTNYKLAMDADGFVWIATSNGVERYDGMTFRPYHLGKSRMRSIEDGFMVSVVKDQHNTLWTYTERNIVTRYNPGEDQFEIYQPLSEKRPEGNINCLYSDGNHLYVGFSLGIGRFDLSKDSMINYYCADQDIRCLEPFDETHILAGTHHGVWLIDLEEGKSTQLTASWMDVNCLKWDKQHRLLWIGSRGLGLHYVHADDWQQCMPVKADDYSIVNVIKPLNSNVMLVGTDGNGLLACQIGQDETGRFRPFSEILIASESASAPCQLPNSVIDDILVDGEKLWLTLDLFGMALLQPRHESPTMVNPLAQANADKNALDVSIDKQGRYWIAFPRCVACYDKPSEEPKIYLQDVSGYLSILAADDGTIWCGGYNAGTYHLDPATGKYDFYPSVVNNKVLDCVYAFAEDYHHDIWIGGLNFGLTRMHKTQDGDYEPTTFPEVKLVTDIRVLNQDTVLVGTFDGVWVVDSKEGMTSRFFSEQDGWELTNSFASLAVVNDHEIWLGTMGAGLAHYDFHTRQSELYGLDNSLPSLEIRGVEMLNDSVLCASTEKNGIFAFNTNTHQVIRTLSHSNGQLMGIFSRSSSGSLLNAHVAFGSDKGVVSVGLSEIISERDTFRIFVTGDYLIDDHIHLPYHSRNLDLEFTTNDLYHQNEYRFEYLIKGLTYEWEQLDETRRLHYLSLPPGSYTIDIRSYSANTLTGQHRITVDVDQILWLRWYCVLAYLLLILALIWFVVNHYRIKHISETDSLTGIRNRYAGQKSTTELLQERTRGVFVLLDCDKFKHVNDTYGHLAGDELLKRVANALETTFPHDITMRLGGDEFAFFLVGYKDNDALHSAFSQFFREIESIKINEMGDYKPSVSMGAAVYDGKEDTNFEQLYTKADHCLYESKKHEGCWITVG